MAMAATEDCMNDRLPPHETSPRTSPSFQLWRPLAALAFGQFLSLLITATGIASSHLARVGINAPTTQSLCNYLLLTLVYVPVLLYRRKKLQVSWYWYVILSIVDVEANYLVVKAYQYTSITSVMLLDRGSLLFVLALSWSILKVRYNLGQFSGIIICTCGVIFLFLSDVQPLKNLDANGTIKGDILVLLASLLYAISNIMEEVLSRACDFIELMALLGVFGSILSVFQLSVLEIHELRTIKWTAYAIAPFLGFAVSLFAFYTLVPIFLKINGSTMLNLSLTTTNVWAILVQRFLYHQKLLMLYFVAFVVVALGLTMYSFFTRSLESNSMEKHIIEPQDEEATERKLTIHH